MTNALLGNGRLNNFRLNALSPALVKTRRTKVGIILNGQDVRTRVRVKSLTIRDAINDAPNSASFAIEGPPSSPYLSAVLADAPLAYWRLGDLGTTALDQSGHGHTGTVFGSVALNQPGAVADGDRAMHFPGIAGARVEVAAAPEFALTNGVTIEAWVKTDLANQQGGLVEKTIGGGVNTSYSLMQLGTSWLFRIVGTFGIVDLTAPVEAADVGQWVHLVGGWTNSLVARWLYKNGTLAAQGSVAAGSITAGAGVLLLGHLGSNIYPFTGAIDEVAIYPYLSGDRIAAHYASGRASAAPTVAQDLRITLGIDSPVLLFNGALTQVDLTYEGAAHTPIYHCSATDDTARANRRRPFGSWVNVSATVVARALITQFVPGFGSLFVQANLPPITVFFDGSEGMNRCLTQITNLIGGYWYFEDKQLHLFQTESSDPPDPIDLAHPFLADPRIASSIEMSQVRTRVYGRGHGEALLADVTSSEPLLPIANAVMFSASGGKAIAGPQSFTYGGRVLGGDGSLVGPGAAPAVAPTCALSAGSGLTDGGYGYAYTFVTASGESLVGPTAIIVVGLTAAPPTAPTVSAPQVGSGPNPGTHQYAVTFVTASGETTSGPAVLATTGSTPAPTTAPTTRVSTTSAPTNPESGTYDYVMTFVTAAGETLPSPVSLPVTIANSPAHYVTNVPGPQVPGYYSDNWTPVAWHPLDNVRYAMSAHTAAGESLPSQGGSIAGKAGTNPNTVWSHDVRTTSVPDPAVIGRSLYRYVNNVSQGRLWYIASNVADYSNPWNETGQTLSGDKQPESVNGAFVPGTAQQQIALSDLPRGDANVTSRNLYRRLNGAGAFLLAATIPNNTATTYTDTAPAASLGAAAPTSSTATVQQFILTDLPLGGAVVMSRKIYRTAAGGSVFGLAATVADNTTTKWTDTIADAQLGAAPPTTNTATANRVQLTAIAIGPSTVTARKVYRTPCNGGGALKYLWTLADNTTTTLLDAAPDAQLGVPPPVADNSGLTQPQGQINAGSTSIITASAAPFVSTGGWVVIGTQVVRYTGISGNVLTGIPSSGPGMLQATVRYGDHILAADMLTGVVASGGFVQPGGTVIYIWIQRDDLAAQQTMKAYDGGDGIYEYLVQDERRGEPSLTALCDAHLLAYRAPIQSLTYATRDLKTKSGKPISVDLVAPPIYGTLTIQDVTIDQIDISPGVAPRFTVVASSVRFSLEDLLRQLAGSLEGQT